MNSCTSSFRRYLTWFVSIVLTLLFLFFGFSEWLLRTKVEPQDILFAHVEFFHTTQARNAVFGDSHTSKGFTGQADFANLGYPSENIRTACRKAQLYFENRDPEIVILQVDPHLFADYRLKEDEQLRFYREADNAKFSWWELRVANNYFRRDLFQYWKKFLTGPTSFVSRFHMEDDGAILDSRSLEATSDLERQKQVQTRLAFQLPTVDIHSHPFGEDISSTIQYLKGRGARVVLVSFPVSPEYRIQAEQNPSYQNAFKAFATFAEREEVEYLNFCDAFDELQMFSDADHLSPKGARQFAELLVRNLRASVDTNVKVYSGRERWSSREVLRPAVDCKQADRIVKFAAGSQTPRKTHASSPARQPCQGV